jgi:Ca2+-binding EF-hand superfamily protein
MRAFTIISLSLMFSLIVTFPISAEEKTAPKRDNSQPVQRQTIVVTAGGAAFQGGAFRGTGYVIRADEDANDMNERLLLLTPRGPLVVELAMTLDGQPFRMHREKMVDELLKSADTDGDGQATWEEALSNPRLTYGRLGNLNQDKATLDRAIQQYDQNKNGIVDRVEARGLIAQISGGPAFIIMNQNYGQPASAPVLEVLDTNKDGVLSAEEIAAAEARLKSRDANDNDILDQAELSGTANAGYGFNRPGGMQQAAPLLYQLDSTTDWNVVFDALQKRYGKQGVLSAESFPAVPNLAEQLDANANKTIEREELAGLKSVAPHLQLAVNLGDTGKLPVGITITSLAEPLRNGADAVTTPDGSAVKEIPGTILQMVASNVAVNYNYDAQVNSMFVRYDKDKNGYLEASEFEGQQAAFAQQFALWDANDDGKVYPDEMKQSYERLQAPQMNRIAIAALNQGNALFAALDANGDGRLGLREMRNAPAALKAVDKNTDGQITSDEVPGVIRLAVARGNNVYQALYPNQRGSNSGSSIGYGQAAQPVRAAGPEWFTRMDRNGDGDVTLREFLGDAEQFKQLDTNGDGFIDAKEAEAVDE